MLKKQVLEKAFKFLQEIEGTKTYETKKVADKVMAEDNNGIGVSTIYTLDEGYETALLDKDGVYPVERYKTKKFALIGHKKWTMWAKDRKNKTVVKLGGFGGIVRNEEIKLKRLPFNIIK